MVVTQSLQRHLLEALPILDDSVACASDLEIGQVLGKHMVYPRELVPRRAEATELSKDCNESKTG